MGKPIDWAKEAARSGREAVRLSNEVDRLRAELARCEAERDAATSERVQTLVAEVTRLERTHHEYMVSAGAMLIDLQAQLAELRVPAATFAGEGGA